MSEGPVLTGGCQCGAVRYRLLSRPSEPGICHCRMCQKAVGNYMAAFAGVPRADLVWTRGQPGSFRSSEAVERGFCRDCGTPLTYAVQGKDRISVTIGSLDNPDGVEPVEQFGVESRTRAFGRLHLLPAVRTEDGTPPELLARMKSRQHPDHDTENWTPQA